MKLKKIIQIARETGIDRRTLGLRARVLELKKTGMLYLLTPDQESLLLDKERHKRGRPRKGLEVIE